MVFALPLDMPQTIKYLKENHEFVLELSIGGLTMIEAKEILVSRLGEALGEPGSGKQGRLEREALLDTVLCHYGVTFVEVIQS